MSLFTSHNFLIVVHNHVHRGTADICEGDPHLCRLALGIYIGLLRSFKRRGKMLIF